MASKMRIGMKRRLKSQLKQLWLPMLLAGGLGLFLVLGGHRLLSWQSIALHYGALSAAAEANLLFAAATFFGIYIIAVAFSLPVNVSGRATGSEKATAMM